MKKIILLLIFYSPFFCLLSKNSNDLTIVGYIAVSDGIGSIPIRIMSCLKEYNLNINWINSRNHISVKHDELPRYVIKHLRNKQEESCKIGIFTDVLWYQNIHWHRSMPKKCHIKFAYSMLEGDKIPNEWVRILNNKFDGVLVPDEFLINVYKNSGVTIPIFVLPLALLNLNKFINNAKYKPMDYRTFVFGNTCILAQRKNHIRLIEAFAKYFKNNPEVKLIINARGAEDHTFKAVTDKIKELDLKNVQLNIKVLSNLEYFELLNSFNCFVSLSQGEGFAIPPRESLALGIPTILTNNTAHSTICNTGLALPVPSNILVPATYFGFNNHMRKVGHAFDCTINDAASALKNVFNNYEKFLKLAFQGKEWVKAYLPETLKAKYFCLMKPKKVTLRNENIITENEIITNSSSLYKKYLSIIQN